MNRLKIRWRQKKLLVHHAPCKAATPSLTTSQGPAEPSQPNQQVIQPSKPTGKGTQAEPCLLRSGLATVASGSGTQVVVATSTPRTWQPQAQRWDRSGTWGRKKLRLDVRKTKLACHTAMEPILQVDPQRAPQVKLFFLRFPVCTEDAPNPGQRDSTKVKNTKNKRSPVYDMGCPNRQNAVVCNRQPFPGRQKAGSIRQRYWIAYTPSLQIMRTSR